MSHATRLSRIVGVGALTPQGVTAAETFERILGGALLRETGHVPLPRDSSDRATQLAIAAARMALEDAGLRADAFIGSRTALIVGTSKGTIERWAEEASATRPPARPLIGLADLSFDLAAALGLVPEFRLTCSAACASGLHALAYADGLIRAGACDRALVVAAESSLGELFQATFHRLGVLAPAGHGCRPFDRSRRGFILSEAGVAVCLDNARGEDAPCIERIAFLGDAYHLTGTDPAGTTIEHLLRTLTAGPIDFVHAHGTGTELMDPLELRSIDRVLGHDRPPVFSHKAALGHSQGAAGLLGVVLNVLAHRRQQLLPNSSCHDPLPTQGARLHYGLSQPLRRSLCIAAGFGGAIAGTALWHE